jgi:flagellar motility protein MotE (MotC chaperone)
VHGTPSRNLRRHAGRGDRCEVCGSEIEKRTFRVVVPHWQGTFDCVECALTVADRGAAGADPLRQAEELAAELFVARLAGENTKTGSESLRVEMARLSAALDEERLKARELEQERDRLAEQLAQAGGGPATEPDA